MPLASPTFPLTSSSWKLPRPPSFATSVYRLLQTDVESKRGYPRTEVNCRFFQPLHFDEEVLTELSIARLRASRISYAFTFKKSGGTPCAQGAMTTSFVERQADGSLHPQPLPENVITALQPYLGSG
jgi:acyl-CoA thioesterase FadM